MSERYRRRVRRSDGAWGRLASALAVLGLVVVGIPALLVVCARAGLGSPSPLPGIGSADEIRTFFERQLTTTEIVPMAGAHPADRGVAAVGGAGVVGRRRALCR